MPTERKPLAEKRYDRYGEFRLITEAEGYVMARRKGCTPFLITRTEWDSFRRYPIPGPKLVLVDGKILP